MNSGIKNPYWFVLLLTGITAVIYWPIYSGAFTLGGEASDLLLPVLSHIREAIMQGDWPLWNKYQSQGLATDIFPLYWNPIFLISGAVFPNPALALNGIYLSLLILAGTGFYKLSGLVTEDQKTAVLGGLCYPILGFFCVNGSEIATISAAAWTPILVYLNHRYQKSGHTHSLILIALGYYLLVTMTSPGFILMVSALLICQAWWYLKSGPVPTFRLWYLGGTLAAAGFLVWRILWTREMSYVPSPSPDLSGQSILRFLYDLTSFILPKTTAVPTPLAGLEGPASFHFYSGIIILTMALVGLFFKTTGLDRRLVRGALVCLIAAGLASFAGEKWPGWTFWAGEPFIIFLKMGLTSLVLLLGLRGMEKIVNDGPQIKYGILLLSLIGAGIGFYIENTVTTSGENSLISWYIQLDAWKSAFFLILTAIALWIPSIRVRYWLIGVLILADAGVINVLNQDLNLYHDYPIAGFAENIRYPEVIHSPIDVDQPAGRYSDLDFASSGLNHNTGTLFKHLVRDGYWPWVHKSRASVPDSTRQRAFRYPLSYLSRDTSGVAAPTIFNLDDEIHIETQGNHLWVLSVLNHHEKYLILNQNFDPNWRAFVDELQIPVERTLSGAMRIPVKPGSFRVKFDYIPDGILNLFGVMMVVAAGLILFLLLKKKFPIPVLMLGIPWLVIYLINPDGGEPVRHVKSVSGENQEVYKMTYEERVDRWFVRGDQLTIVNSHGGYRSELFNEEFIYSATLQLPATDLEGIRELEYRFHLHSDQPVDLGVVLKTYGFDGESYNIDYLNSLESGGWTTVEGLFRLDSLSGPLDKAEWYIWNYKEREFLIDDIEIKLNP